MTTYSYARVSTDRQANEGESLAVQARTCAGYAAMRGLVVEATFVERGVSGSVPLGDRPEGARLLSLVRGGDDIIAAKLDRLFRSARDALSSLEQIKQRGVRLHLIDLGGDVTENGVAKLTFTILSAVAEAERDRIRERISDVKADQRKRARFLGGRVPFGFVVSPDGALVNNPNEQVALETMKTLRTNGASLRKIARELREAGHSISHEGVRSALLLLRSIENCDKSGRWAAVAK